MSTGTRGIQWNHIDGVVRLECAETRDSLLAELEKAEKKDAGRTVDPLLWQCPLATHAFGSYSFCVVQANKNLEDYAEVQTGPLGTFVGVYDGHGGAEAAEFLQKHLYRNLQSRFTPCLPQTPLLRCAHASLFSFQKQLLPREG